MARNVAPWHASCEHAGHDAMLVHHAMLVESAILDASAVDLMTMFGRINSLRICNGDFRRRHPVLIRIDHGDQHT